MTDSTSDDNEKYEQQDEPIATASDIAALPVVGSATSYSKDLHEIQTLVSRYINQLVNGCDDTTCREILCDTGRHNTSQKPTRKYTPRSARAIALAIASGPRPRSRLCVKHINDSGLTRGSDSEGPRDPSSFIQQLCDTSAIRQLCDVSATPRSVRSRASSRRASSSDRLDEGYTFWHAKLRDLSRLLPTSSNTTLVQIQWENRIISARLSECIAWLLHGLSSGSPVQWQHVNRIVGKGNAYPASNVAVPFDSSHNNWLDILDSLEYDPSFRLLCEVLAMMARRDLAERRIIRAANRQHEPGIFGNLMKSTISKLFTRDSATRLPVRLNLVVWLKKAFLRHWDGSVRASEGTISFISLEILDNICGHSVQPGPSNRSQDDLLTIPVVASRLDAIELVRKWKDAPQEGHLLNYAFLFSINQLTTYFRMSNHLSMRKANSDAEMASAIRSRGGRTSIDERLKPLEERYLLLHVRREHVLQDAFDQLWQRRKAELLLPLRVRLGEMGGLEVGHDLGGVQIEFFNLVCKAVLDESAQMFTTDPLIGLSYFRAGSLQPVYMFELCGLLFALAIYNGISLPINFPMVLYNMLRDDYLSLDSIEDAWPVVWRSLREIQTSAGEDMTIENSFPLEVNGLRLSVGLPDEVVSGNARRMELQVYDATPIVHEEDRTNGDTVTSGLDKLRLADVRYGVDISDIADAWPGWRLCRALESPGELTGQQDRREYVENYMHWLTVGSVKPQWRAFLSGFKAMPIDVNIVPRETLRSIVEGSTHFNMNDLRKVTTYEGFEPTSKYIRNFWHLVTNWPEEKQKQLLKFVTACERIPPGGASSLTFRIQKATPADLDHLPTSSTCFGTLVLPKYESVSVLDRKLSLALKYGVEGFGSG